MHSSLTFEPASAADVLLLRDLAERIWHESYATMLSPDQIRYMLNWMYAPHKLAAEIERGVEYRVVRLERRPVGYLAWEILSEGPVAHLHKLYLIPEVQGRGLGRRMLEEFLLEARKADARGAELRVNKANARAQKTYRQAGFQVADAVVTDIGGGYVMDDFILRCALPAAADRSGTDDLGFG